MPRPAKSTLLVLAVVALIVPSRTASAQGLEYIKAHYTKYEYRIPMRDGVRLFTAVYVPKETSEPHPILLTRTPYSVRPYGADQYPGDLGPSPLFGSAGYIVAYQDVRGRWMSEGRFVNVRPQRPTRDDPQAIDESTDAFDTIEWLIKHVPNHNGKVGMWGISYPGFYTAAALIDAHPALKAASPQAPVTDWFVGDDFRHNGALFLPHAFNFLATFGRPRPEPTRNFKFEFDHGTPDGYTYFLNMGPLVDAGKKYFKNDVEFWDELIAHDTYDESWKARDIRPHLKDIRPAVMTVGGWFDAEDLFGALETYRNIEQNHPKASNTLVMGPWLHGGWSRGEGDALGHVPFNAKTSAFYREHIEFPFFEFHLKGKGKDESERPEAWVFETGRNQWRRHDAWPPKSARPRSLYLRDEGRLAFEPPAANAKGDVFDEYVSDPSRPVPFLGDVAINMKPEYMVDDQRFASRRPDVLVYQTDALENDVTLAGPIKADLFVSTSGTDSDWVVKLIDVYPNDYPDPTPNPTGVRMGGFQQLVRGEPMRGKFRDSLETPKPFTPESPTPVQFTLPDVYHTFRPGHRIMVQIQSTWFPLVDRNPQQFMEIARAKPSDFHKATQRVYRSEERASRLKVQVLP